MISKDKDKCNSIQYKEGQNGQEMRRSSTLEKCADDQRNEEGCILSEFDNVDAKLVYWPMETFQKSRFRKNTSFV